MEKNTVLSISMSRWETTLGWAYLVAELFLLPDILLLLNRLLPVPLNSAWLNFVYFSVNFLNIGLIFHRFLASSLVKAGKQPGQTLLSALLGFGCYWAASLILGYLIPLLIPDFANANDRAIASMAEDGYAAMVIGTVILVPVAEETLYRGLIFRGLYSRSRAAAYVLSTAFFCAIHVAGFLGAYPPLTLLACFIQYIPAGLCLAWAYVRADTILAPILIHTLINAIGISAMR